MNSLGTPFYAPTFLAAINWLTQIVEVSLYFSNFLNFSTAKPRNLLANTARKPARACCTRTCAKRTASS